VDAAIQEILGKLHCGGNDHDRKTEAEAKTNTQA